MTLITGPVMPCCNPANAGPHRTRASPCGPHELVRRMEIAGW
jgi:hypothetical protein